MKICKSFAALIIILVWCESCTPSDSRSTESEQTIKSSIPPTEVSVILAEVKPFEYFIIASGKIASAAEVRMQFRRAGIIQKILVSNSQLVTKGQLLALLDNGTQELAFSKAKLMLQEKTISFNDMMLSYQSIKDSSRYANANKNIRISSGLAGAEIAYEEARLEYENSFVRAQIAGVISGIEVNSGSPVSHSELLCYIHDPRNLIVHAEVLEADALQLKNGTRAEIRPTAIANEVYAASVENINPRVDDKTGLVKVTLKLIGRSNVFPGMHVQATMSLPYDKHVVVPKEALVVRSGKFVVFTINNNQAKWNYVTIGRENGKEVEVLEGLQKGDSVIVTNNLQLAHDASLSVVKN